MIKSTITNYIQKKDFEKSVDNGEYVLFTYILRVYEISVDTDNATSKIGVHAILKQDWNGDMFIDWATGVSCTLNGTEIFYSYIQRELTGTREHLYYEWIGDVAHDKDGNLTLKVGGKVWQNNPTYFLPNGITIQETASNTMIATPINVGGHVLENVNNTFKKGTVFINNQGTWKKGTVSKNDQGTWKKSK